MAQIILTPEGKFSISRLNKFQLEFTQGLLEYARAEVEKFFTGSAPANLKEWKLDKFYRKILKVGEIHNLPGKIQSFLVPFTDQQSIDPDDVAATITAIKANLTNWVLLEADVNPGDDTINGNKDAETGAFVVV